MSTLGEDGVVAYKAPPIDCVRKGLTRSTPPMSHVYMPMNSLIGQLFRMLQIFVKAFFKLTGDSGVVHDELISSLNSKTRQ
jgi:hypothetical protein